MNSFICRCIVNAIAILPLLVLGCSAAHRSASTRSEQSDEVEIRIAMSGDGARLVVTKDDALTVWEVRRDGVQKLIERPASSLWRAACLAPDGSWLAACDADDVFILSSTNGNVERQFKITAATDVHVPMVRGFALSATGKTLALLLDQGSSAPPTATLAQETPSTMPAQGFRIPTTEYDPPQSPRKCQLIVWNLNNGNRIAEVAIEDARGPIAVSDDGHWAAYFHRCGIADPGFATVHNTVNNSTNVFVSELKTNSLNDLCSPVAIVFIDQDTALCAVDWKVIANWSLLTREAEWMEPGIGADCVATICRGAKLAFVASDKFVWRKELVRSSPSWDRNERWTIGPVKAIAASDDGRRMAVVTTDHEVSVWDCEAQPRRIATIPR